MEESQQRHRGKPAVLLHCSVVCNLSKLPHAAVKSLIFVNCLSPLMFLKVLSRFCSVAGFLLQLDKLCPFTVKTAQTLPPTTGTAMWEPSDLVPDAAYFVRAFAICPNATYGTSPCGVGNSKGFFQVNQIQSRPGNLKGAVIGMIFAGPIIFFAYLAIDSCLSKRRTKKGSKDAAQTQHIPHEADEKLTTLT